MAETWFILRVGGHLSLIFSLLLRIVCGQDSTFGILAAFGDYNSDKVTDLFQITNDGHAVEVLLGSNAQFAPRKAGIRCDVQDGVVTSVVPADYNGDTLMDILVTVHPLKESDPNINVIRIMWGGRDVVYCNNLSLFTTRGQPLLMDTNTDMIPDLFGETEAGQRRIWTYSSTASVNFTWVNMNGSDFQKLRIPHSCAFIDVDGDKSADLVVTGEKQIEYWSIIDGSLKEIRSIPYPNTSIYKVIGQSVFMDVNMDGLVDHVIPVCTSIDCHNSSIVAWHRDRQKWETLADSFQDGNHTWRFVPETVLLDAVKIPITLHAADFDMDGYPELLTVMTEIDSNKPVRRAVLLKNVYCPTCPWGRSFITWWDPKLLGEPWDIQLATFYDLFENGVMDIIVGFKMQNNKWEIQAIENTISYDACFLKVLVFSGNCYQNCPNGSEPYSSNVPGPFIRYHTTTPEGLLQVSCAGQMPQSAYFPLQLPYSVFGLGPTPNFVDQLEVAIPGIRNNKVNSHEWTQIIPNSQMVVIPYPVFKPEKWIEKLFITPSHIVILTAVALVGTCGFIGLIIGALHWKERREDRREKLQEAHRFHFDAM